VSTIPPAVRTFVEQQPVGVLATYRADGSVRQGVVYHLLEGDRILVSTEGKRYKAGDVRRAGRASYCVLGHERPFPCVTLEGSARIVTDGAGAETSRLFDVIFGPRDAPPFTDEEAAAMDRVILEITVERVYGARYVEGA
jgi:PPOX class probable F420-dependent enzyme